MLKINLLFKNIFINVQHSFKSCRANLINLVAYNFYSNLIGTDAQIYVIHTDLQKAIDSVNSDILLIKFKKKQR